MVIYNKEVEQSRFTPRDYQVELLDKACKRNVIVQLGTGAGKTFIAVLLLKEYGLQLIPPYSKGGKRAFFIVDKVALVDQQADHIRCHTTLTVAQMHGNLNSDIWNDRECFEKFLEDTNVIVITAQVLLDLLSHAFFDLTRAAVLIFDECHHALGSKHPYRVIMDRYMRIPEGQRPRILGLTASLINNKTPPNQLESKLSKLENVLNSAIETASDLVSISKFGAKPEQLVVICDDFVFKESDLMCNRVLKVLDDVRLFCERTSEFDPDFDIDIRRPILEAIMRTTAVLKQIGPWAAWKVAQIWEKELRKFTKEFLPPKSLDFLAAGETCMNLVKRLLEPTMRPIKSLVQLKPFLPHKVIRLLDCFISYSPERQAEIGTEEPLSCIIFVNQRYVAYVMSVLLKHICKWEPTFKFIQADFVIGYSAGSFASDDSQSIHKRQEMVLRKFRQGDLNVLVATNVLEEGVDVKQCNLVVKFDRPIEYRSYVQSKGRARKAGAHYIVLVDRSDNEKCSDDLRDFIEIEKLLLKRYRTVHNPGDQDYICSDNVDHLAQPYVVKSTGAIVTLSTAIPLVNRYCGKLPSDIFTRLVPQNRIIPVNCNGVQKYKAELLLPINSPLKKPIRLETPVESKKLAQMCVALECCRLLHKEKELNDHLLPVGRESIAVLLQLDEDPDEYTGERAKVGSARRKQLYDKRVAKALNEALPVVGTPCYLYVMELELIREPTVEHNPKRRKFARPEEYEYCFGFVSSKKFPKIPSFPAYLRQGDMRVNVTLAHNMIMLDDDVFEKLQKFHHYIFTYVLQLAKDNVCFGLNESAPLNVLVVPLNRVVKDGINDYSLNMTYIEQVVNSDHIAPKAPTEEERKKYKFRADDYKDAVVMPWYRNLENPAYFYVAEVIESMTPASKFPDSDYESFNHYFREKYNLTIYDQEQNLLDVDFTSNRLNLLLPRTGGSRKRSRTENSQHQIFVPELMDKHPISATLWNLISALPSFFYRINHLLLADELRKLVLTSALEIPEDKTKPRDDFEWPPLSYPATYEEKQSLIVSKIQQLREMNKVQDREGNSNLDSSVSDPEGQFEIGVWDPELASGLMFTTPGPAPPLQPVDSDDTVGLISNKVQPAGDMSDEDDDDAEAVILCDYAKYIAEKAGNRDFAAPRADIVESGWGDFDDEVPDAPFQMIVSSSMNQFNMSALMADLQSQILPLPAQSSHSTAAPASNSRPRTAVSEKVRATKSQIAAMGTDFDDRLSDRDKSQKEEIVDLMEIDDEDDDVCVAASVSRSTVADGSTSDDEFMQLEEGEKSKSLQDASVIYQDVISKGQNEVLAPPLESTFSFAKPSPTAGQTLTTASPEGPGLDLMSENPYGVSPCLLLTALTTANANDGINLERLETIGDSFLKYAVTDYLYHIHKDQHEGKLSFARSKEVSNCNLYRLGKRLGIPSLIVGSKFDVQDSWLPPCYAPSMDFKAPNAEDLEESDRYIEKVLDAAGDSDVLEEKKKDPTGWDQEYENDLRKIADGVETITFTKQTTASSAMEDIPPLPYNMLTQQYISDKSIADAMEALIGAHLLTLGPHPTLKVMKWMGLKVLTPNDNVAPPEPLLRFVDTVEDPLLSSRKLNEMYQQFQFGHLEDTIKYRFKDKAYLIQAFTHASYYKNRITGCYQRLEFLGDAVLDYMITRFLYEDSRQYSPGVLTDLRSALVNNTIFASLSVKYEFHKHFVAMCPSLHHMIEKFVRLCKEKNFFDANFNAEMYMITTEEEIDEGQEEDIEVPKAMSDIFESVAGAIYLDSGRDLDVVWRVVHNLMKDTISECCANPPRSPIRELMELEPNKTQFSKMERILETGKVRVTVQVSKNMKFTGMGRNYRIAKTTAAKRALKYLKTLEEQKLRDAEKREKEKFQEQPLTA